MAGAPQGHRHRLPCPLSCLAAVHSSSAHLLITYRLPTAYHAVVDAVGCLHVFPLPNVFDLESRGHIGRKDGKAQQNLPHGHLH